MPPDEQNLMSLLRMFGLAPDAQWAQRLEQGAQRPATGPGGMQITPNQAQMVNAMAMPATSFEAESYPMVVRAMDRLQQAAKSVQAGSDLENDVGRHYWDMRNYLQALHERTGMAEPTVQALRKMKPQQGTTVTRDLLSSEMREGEKSPKAVKSTTIGWSRPDVRKMLQDAESLIARIYQK